MKSVRFIHTILLFVLCGASAIAQLSPGDLASSHAHLEGLKNCFKCHEIGAKISDKKCLDCHSILKKQIDSQKGFHVSKEVKGKSCSSCHSDHHGRNFAMIKFDETTFDHKLTGYNLLGAHKSVDCRDCHQASSIRDPQIKKIKDTFLGLATDCTSCHEDYHQNTLSEDCLSCHDMEAFEPASKFDHSKTDFPLKGLHQSADCKSCHEITEKRGQTFQVFTEIDHGKCSDCHSDVHQGQLGNNCTSCHSENTFNKLNRNFNHNSTGFVLQGKHKHLDCKICHNNNYDLTRLFKEFRDQKDHSCITCHEDVHQNKFGPNCSECHSTQTFKIKGKLNSFDHSLTNFSLEGKHRDVDCKSCHGENMTEALAHEKCSSCHEDFHQGRISSNPIKKDCAFCHNVDGFSPTTYSIDNHQVSAFPLKGAHIATPCILCHLQDEKWTFNFLANDCIACHQDVHEGLLDEKYYPDNDCTYCHTEEQWPDIHFDHTITAFELLGKHKGVDCRKCHISDNPDKNIATGLPFKVSSSCESCHDDNHRRQFTIKDEGTDCSNCHSSDNWTASNFNHDSTAFKLDGIHLEIACSSCHYDKNDEIGTYVYYKIESFECSDCH